MNHGTQPEPQEKSCLVVAAEFGFLLSVAIAFVWATKLFIKFVW